MTSYLGVNIKLLALCRKEHSPRHPIHMNEAAIASFLYFLGPVIDGLILFIETQEFARFHGADRLRRFSRTVVGQTTHCEGETHPHRSYIVDPSAMWGKEGH